MGPLNELLCPRIGSTHSLLVSNPPPPPKKKNRYVSNFIVTFHCIAKFFTFAQVSVYAQVYRILENIWTMYSIENSCMSRKGGGGGQTTIIPRFRLVPRYGWMLDQVIVTSVGPFGIQDVFGWVGRIKNSIVKLRSSPISGYKPGRTTIQTLLGPISRTYT